MTTRFCFLASVFSLAAMLTVSCGDSGTDFLAELLGSSSSRTSGAGSTDLLGNFLGIGSSNLLQNNRLGFQASTGTGATNGSAEVITDVKINGSALSGGSTGITVTSREELEELYLRIGQEEGYYRWVLDDGDLVSSSGGSYVYYIVLEFSQGLGNGQGDGSEESIPFVVSGLTKDGTITKEETETMITKSVGSGKLQINVSWSVNDDVDLHVYGPNGRPHLYYGSKWSENPDANLDVDSNAGCTIDGINSENVFFEDPLQDGVYTVVVNLFSKCVRGTTNKYTVTANSGGFFTFGGENQSGSFDGSLSGNSSSLSSGIPASSSTTKVIGTITVRNGVVVR